ncbi:hypothetical protein F9C11_21575 [Amycolatopsis sp. VS8301801F10]|uniref:hypothetical protein n=1 Tax=Amycolatopsis sp. VS8301801F10 TaxID=2652442 RepID=UPI0038FC3483
MLRRTPLQRRGFLARDAALARTPMKRARGRTKAEQRSGWSEANGRAVVRARSGGTCEVRVLGVCEGRAAEWQHRKARSQGGEWNPANGLHTCQACHRWIHQNPTEATAAGWTVPREEDPAAVPVEDYPNWGRVLLGNDGVIHIVQKGQTA